MNDLGTLSVYILCGQNTGAVYFGEIKSDPDAGCLPGMLAERAPFCLHHAQTLGGPLPESVRSWLDLAANGPGPQCFVSPEVDTAIISEVREILVCSPKAVEAWKKAPWGSAEIKIAKPHISHGIPRQ